MDRVFEIGRVFRNEGVDRCIIRNSRCSKPIRPTPDYNDMMTLAEKNHPPGRRLLQQQPGPHAAQQIVVAQTAFRSRDHDGSFQKYAGVDVIAAWKQGKLRDVAQNFNITAEEKTPDHKSVRPQSSSQVKPHLWRTDFRPGLSRRDFAARQEIHAV